MMKKTLVAIAVCIPLAGCNTATLEQIQAASVQACGFLPTAVMVAGVVPAITPYAAPAGVIAQAICDAVIASQPKTARRGAALTRSGVRQVSIRLPNGSTAVVTGRFVR